MEQHVFSRCVATLSSSQPGTPASQEVRVSRQSSFKTQGRHQVKVPMAATINGFVPRRASASAMLRPTPDNHDVNVEVL